MFGIKKSKSTDKPQDSDQDKSAPSNTPESKPESNTENDGSPVATPESQQADAEIGTLPSGDESARVSPPLKPFKKEPLMSNPPSSSYRPDIPRKAVDIPNPSRASSEQSDAPDEDDGKRLVVGKAISLNGDISACETLVVHGTVEANVTDATTLEVANGGLFKGEAEVDHAYIDGTFEGTLRARMTLEVSASGHVKGTINYNNISIASGGRVQGTIDAIDAT